jgi:hypothetical protein
MASYASPTTLTSLESVSFFVFGGAVLFFSAWRLNMAVNAPGLDPGFVLAASGLFFFSFSFAELGAAAAGSCSTLSSDFSRFTLGSDSDLASGLDVVFLAKALAIVLAFFG